MSEYGFGLIYDNQIDRILNKIKNKSLIYSEIQEISMDESLLKYIHNLSMQAIYRTHKKIRYPKDRYNIILSLSLIGFEYYDRNFWGHVNDTYAEMYEKHTELTKQKVYIILNKILKKYTDHTGKESRLITDILYNCIVPKNYLNEFYSILLEVYVNIFRATLPEDEVMYEILNSIYMRISEKESTDDTLQSSLSNQSYKLIRSTKMVMEKPRFRNDIVNYSINILKAIHMLMENAEEIDNSNFSYIWAKEWLPEYGRQRFKKLMGNKNNTSDSIIRITPEIILEELNRLIFCTKTIILPSDVDFSDIKIKIYHNNELVYYDKEPEIYDEGFAFVLPSQEIEIEWNPFNMVLEIEGMEEYGYSCNEKYFFFDENGKRLINTQKNKEELYIITEKNVSVKNVTSIFESDHFKIDYVLEESDFIEVDGKVIDLLDIKEPILLGVSPNKIKGHIRGTCIDVYNRDLKLFIPNDDSIESIIFNCNNKVNTIAVDTLIDSQVFEIDHSDIGLNIIELKLFYKDGSINYYNFRYIYDDIISFEFYDELENDNLKIITKLNLEDNVYTIKEGNGNVFDVDYLSHGVEFSISYFLPIPFYHKKSNDELKLISDYLWRDDFELYDRVEIIGIEAQTLRIYNQNEDVISDVINAVIDNGNYKFEFDLGATLKLNDDTTNYLLEFSNNDNFVKSFLFLNNLILDEEDLFVKYNPNRDELLVRVDNYLGNSSIRVDLYEGEDIVASKLVNQTEMELVFSNIKRLGRYKFSFFDHEKNLLLHEIKPFVATLKDLVGQKFKVDMVYVDYDTNDTREHKVRHSFLEFTNHTVEENVFIAKVFYTTKFGATHYFRNISNVKVEIDGEFESIDYIEVYINDANEDEMLYFNVKWYQIVDDLDPKGWAFKDLYKAVISMR